MLLRRALVCGAFRRSICEQRAPQPGVAPRRVSGGPGAGLPGFMQDEADDEAEDMFAFDSGAAAGDPSRSAGGGSGGGGGEKGWTVADVAALVRNDAPGAAELPGKEESRDGGVTRTVYSDDYVWALSGGRSRPVTFAKYAHWVAEKTAAAEGEEGEEDDQEVVLTPIGSSVSHALRLSLTAIPADSSPPPDYDVAAEFAESVAEEEGGGGLAAVERHGRFHVIGGSNGCSVSATCFHAPTMTLFTALLTVSGDTLAESEEPRRGVATMVAFLSALEGGGQA
eukprot:Rhum_TRINITY_DN7765_c0_g1::Rhum_TRINITY_DN7765_c0_g1_i1::g.24588::m.24588